MKYMMYPPMIPPIPESNSAPMPNHIVGKGMVNKIRALYPSANITPIDYDPSATRVNQENRIKLMLAVAKERLNAPAQAAPMTAEEIAGGAPRVETTV